MRLPPYAARHLADGAFCQDPVPSSVLAVAPLLHMRLEHIVRAASTIEFESLKRWDAVFDQTQTNSRRLSSIAQLDFVAGLKKPT